MQTSTCIARTMASSSDKSSPCNAETAVLSHDPTTQTFMSDTQFLKTLQENAAKPTKNVKTRNIVY